MIALIQCFYSFIHSVNWENVSYDQPLVRSFKKLYTTRRKWFVYYTNVFPKMSVLFLILSNWVEHCLCSFKHVS